jgi:hypothetical protein
MRQRQQAKPTINFSTRVDLATDDLRRRLQERTGYATPRLVAEALRVLEAQLATGEAAAA